MPEYYNLPVLFTEEERRSYAAWGIKKSKALKPFAIITIIIDILVALGTFLYFFHAMGGANNLFLYIATWGETAGSVSYCIAIIFTILTVKPLDWILDTILKKPQPPKMLRLEPTAQGVQYQLFREKKLLSQGLLSWNEWQSAVNHLTNQIWIERQCLTIGANTIESIYPRDKRHKWMDHPAEKIVGTISLGKIQKNLEGYLASLEEQEKEAEWLKQNGQTV